MQSNQVNELVKQFDMMAPIMKSMAGKGIKGRMDAIRELQQSGMLDPGGRAPRTKQGTGKRINTKNRNKMRKMREKELRKKRRQNKMR